MENKRAKFLDYAFLGGGLVFFFFLWWLISFILKSNNNSAVPFPWETLGLMGQLCFGEKAGQTWSGIGYTLLRLLLAFAASILVGGILGIIAGKYGRMKKFLFWTVGFAKIVPTAAIVAMFIGIFSGPKNRVLLSFLPSLLVFLVAMPILYEGFAKAVSEENQDIMDALAVDNGKNNLRGLFKVILPDGLPFIQLAIATSLGLSLKVSIMSEVLASGTSEMQGLGWLIADAQRYGDIEVVIAYGVLSLVLMIILDIPLFILKFKRKKSD